MIRLSDHCFLQSLEYFKKKKTKVKRDQGIKCSILPFLQSKSPKRATQIDELPPIEFEAEKPCSLQNSTIPLFLFFRSRRYFQGTDEERHGLYCYLRCQLYNFEQQIIIQPKVRSFTIPPEVRSDVECTSCETQPLQKFT